MRYLITLLTAGLVGNLLLVAPLPAAGLAGLENTRAASESGRIDEINLKHRYLIVDDSRYALAPNAQVQSSTGAIVSLSSLQRGMRIAFALQAGSGGGARTITEVVILPGK
jgi:hypothetical protein